MTLLAPTAAIVAGALAVPSLLVFYFLKLKRRPVRVSSTMLWEDAVHDLQVNAPFRMIRPTWLLLLQLLGLALLVLALGRPAINADRAPAPRTIILIDTSASMQTRDAGGQERPEGQQAEETGPVRTPIGETRIERAKARAIDEVRRLTRAGATVMLIAFDREARALTEFSTDADALIAAIAAIEPTDAPGDPRVALALAETVASQAGSGGLGEQDARDRAAEVVLISDGQIPAGEPVSIAGAIVRYEGVGAPDATQATGNIAVGALSAVRDPEDAAVIRVFARLTNAGPRPAAVSVSLAFQGDVVQRKAVTVPPAEAPNDGRDERAGEGDRAGDARDEAGPGAGAAGALAFGERGVTFQFRSREAGAVTVSIEASDEAADALLADSAASVVIGSPRKPSVVLVLPDERVAEGNWRLTGILEELDLLRLDKRGETVVSEMARDGRLRRYDLVIYDAVTPARVPPVPSLSFGAAPPFEGLVVTEHTGPSRTLSWRRTHPVLRDVSLDTVLVGNASTFELSDEAPPDLEMTELARGEDGAFLVELRRGQTQHIAAGFEVQQSNIWQTPALGLLLANVVDQLATESSGAAGEAFTTGAPVRIAPPPGTRRVRLVLPSPDGEPVEREIELEGREDEAALVNLDRAGLYEVLADGDPLRPLAVNLMDPLESSVARARSIAIGGEEIESVEGGEEPREIWHWFVIAAGIILMTEWLINSILMRT